MYNYFCKSKKSKTKPKTRYFNHSPENTKQLYLGQNDENDENGEKQIGGSSEAIISRRKYSDKYNKAILHSKNRKSHSLFKNKYVAILLFLYISCLFTFWAFSAVIVPIGVYDETTTDINEQYDQSMVYGIFAFIGVTYIVSFFFNRLLNYKIFKSTSFDKRVIVAVQLQCIGYFLLTTFGIHDTATSPYSIPTAQLIFATIFIVVGYGVSTLQIPYLLLITGTKLKNIGIRMSWFLLYHQLDVLLVYIWLLFNQITKWIYRSFSSSFIVYLLIISFIALIIIMEANKSIAFPQKY